MAEDDGWLMFLAGATIAKKSTRDAAWRQSPRSGAENFFSLQRGMMHAAEEFRLGSPIHAGKTRGFRSWSARRLPAIVMLGRILHSRPQQSAIRARARSLRRSHLAPQFGARVVGIETSEFAQKFLGALVPGHGYGDLYFHDFVAAHTIFGSGGHALFAQTQFLAALRAGRNLQQRASVNGGDLDFCAERRFAGGHR